MTRLCLIAALLAVALCTGCAKKAADTPAPEPYIKIEPSGKPAPGQLSMQQGATAEEVGIAFYPEAKVNKSGLVKGPKGAIGGAELQTDKPYAEVVKFYRERYQAHKPEVRTVKEAATDTTMLNWQDFQGNYTVIIKRDAANKRTVVTLARTSK